MSERLTPEELTITDRQLLTKLHLMDGKYLKRAAIMLFARDPSEYVSGAYVRIGYFENDADLIFQDDIYGSLVTITDKVLDILYTKYFKGVIHYEGIQRVDRFPVYKDSMREAVLNAIVHKDYDSYNPIQIKVFPDRVYIFNSCRFPEKWTEKMLFRTHDSVRINPNIAAVMFWTGMIETWGRGIAKIVDGCKRIGAPDPVYEVLPRNMSLMFEAPADGVYHGIADGSDTSAIISDKPAIKASDRETAIIAFIKANGQAKNMELAELLRLSRPRIRELLKPMIDNGTVVKCGDKRSTYYRLKDE